MTVSKTVGVGSNPAVPAKYLLYELEKIFYSFNTSIRSFACFYRSMFFNKLVPFSSDYLIYNMRINHCCIRTLQNSIKPFGVTLDLLTLEASLCGEWWA